MPHLKAEANLAEVVEAVKCAVNYNEDGLDPSSSVFQFCGPRITWGVGGGKRADGDLSNRTIRHHPLEKTNEELN